MKLEMSEDTIKSLNEKIGNEIKNKLKEKYQQEFEIKALGRRLGTAENNSVTTYCYPKENEELLFTIIMDIKGKIRQDTYNIRKVCYFLEKQIENLFKEKNINSYCSSHIYGRIQEIEGKTEEEILQKEEITFFTNVIIKENIQDEDIIEVYNTILERYGNIKIHSNIYIIKNDEIYSKCKEQMYSVPYVLEYMFNKYPTDRKIQLEIKEGKIKI